MNYNNISDSAKIGNNVRFGQFITVGDNVEIGDNCIIESYSYIGYSNGLERSGLSIGKLILDLTRSFILGLRLVKI